VVNCNNRMINSRNIYNQCDSSLKNFGILNHIKIYVGGAKKSLYGDLRQPDPILLYITIPQLMASITTLFIEFFFK